MIRILLATMLGIASPVFGSPYDPLIDYAARSHGVDPIVLRAITAQESRKNPWTFNADGEPFQFKDKESAVRVLWSLTQAPWMVKAILNSGQRSRRFFTTESSARAYAYSAQSAGSLRLRSDDSREVSKGEIRIRPLRLINTDIGIAQVNYRWHGQGIATVQMWFDPSYNLNYAAAHLAELKKAHGSDIAAAGYYHSATPKYRQRYLANFMPKYNEEKRLASSVSLATAR
ncbi:hypothetical protein [Pseudomonas violetae]|uniref:Transglycosylase SLT domain-containing protein n=1 Tax=Pseudomonas violetae TaxID=2915813 RepID=A0ABT0ET50_9PSED|nr:hypothetical protein [Pseudomonas violetae]MCK1788912.1 hypothetical protein [Pseudomonas violetae]